MYRRSGPFVRRKSRKLSGSPADRKANSERSFWARRLRNNGPSKAVVTGWSGQHPFRYPANCDWSQPVPSATRAAVAETTRAPVRGLARLTDPANRGRRETDDLIAALAKRELSEAALYLGPLVPIGRAQLVCVSIERLMQDGQDNEWDAIAARSSLR